MDYKIFASKAPASEITEFTNLENGWGETSIYDDKPPMQWFNYVQNRTDKNLLELANAGVTEWSSSGTYKKGSWAKVGNELYLCTVDGATTNPTALTQWVLRSGHGVTKVEFTSEDEPDSAGKIYGAVGHIYFGLTLDGTSLELNGQLVSKKDYNTLWETIKVKYKNLLVSEAVWQSEASANNNQCSKFVDYSNDKYRLPKINYVKGGGTGYQSAGLPNITGSGAWFENCNNSWKDKLDTQFTGAFYIDYDRGNTFVGSHDTDQDNNVMAFDASKSNTIYGSSDTVEVNAVKGYWQIKATNDISQALPLETADLVNQIKVLTSKIEALENSKTVGLGYDQKWYDVKSSRVLGTKYTNNTDKPILISVSMKLLTDESAVYATIKIDDVSFDFSSGGYNSTGSWKQTSGTFLIPPKSSYTVSSSQSETKLISWMELK